MRDEAQIEYVEVDDPAEIAPGSCRVMRVGDHEVGVFNIDGDFYAMRNQCPHQGAPVCRGQLGGTFVPSAPGTYSFGYDGEVLHCPSHHWEFNVRTGRSMFGVNRARLITHAIRCDGDRVLVSVRPVRVRDDGDGA